MPECAQSTMEQTLISAPTFSLNTVQFSVIGNALDSIYSNTLMNSLERCSISLLNSLLMIASC